MERLKVIPAEQEGRCPQIDAAAQLFPSSSTYLAGFLFSSLPSCGVSFVTFEMRCWLKFPLGFFFSLVEFLSHFVCL